jgi:hypothetical protein
LLHRQEHLIKGDTHDAAGQATFCFHEPHGAGPEILRSQMLYPLSYERRLVWPDDTATPSV